MPVPLELPTTCVYVDGKAVGIIEAKKQGATLTGVESLFADAPPINYSDAYRRRAPHHPAKPGPAGADFRVSRSESINNNMLYFNVVTGKFAICK